MKIPSFVWVILVIVLGVGFLAFLNNQKAASTNITSDNQTLPVKVDVYVDYNCPHCADFEPYVREVVTTYGDKVQLNEKNLPFLADSSTTYAYAVEAARKQDKFDDYSYDLFKWASYLRNPSNTSFTYSDEDKSFYSQTIDPVKLAEKLGLDIDKFQSDMNSDEVKNLVKDQKAEAVKATGTQSTPTVLIYGKIFNMTSFTDLKDKVGELIKSIESKTTANP